MVMCTSQDGLTIGTHFSLEDCADTESYSKSKHNHTSRIHEQRASRHITRWSTWVTQFEEPEMESPPCHRLSPGPSSGLWVFYSEQECLLWEFGEVRQGNDLVAHPVYLPHSKTVRSTNLQVGPALPLADCSSRVYQNQITSNAKLNTKM